MNDQTIRSVADQLRHLAAVLDTMRAESHALRIGPDVAGVLSSVFVPPTQQPPAELKTFWGVPVVVTPGMPEHIIVIGTYAIDIRNPIPVDISAALGFARSAYIRQLQALYAKMQEESHESR